MPSKPIFISHAAPDEEIANQVVDLLNLAMQINVTQDVFCSSVWGCNIPPGVDFKLFIKEQIQTPRLVLLLISQQYLASAFCLAEAGASWAMSHRCIPLLLPPVKFADMKAVLAGTQAGEVNDPRYWNDVFHVFEEVLKVKTRWNRWESKRDEVLEKITLSLKKQKPPPILPLGKYTELEGRLEEANEDLKIAEKEIKRLERLNEALKESKDAEEVAEIELKSLPEFERFERLVKKSTEALKPLPPIVEKALFKHFSGGGLQWPGFGGEEERQEIENAIEDSFLYDQEGEGILINEEDPKISRALNALNDLQRFLERCSEKFDVAYVAQNDHQPKFRSARFWRQHLANV